jgi:hypothetical protein
VFLSLYAGLVPVWLCVVGLYFALLERFYVLVVYLFLVCFVVFVHVVVFKFFVSFV